MVSHLKWIDMRDQKPEAASKSSALLGRYMCGSECGRRSSKCLLDAAEASVSGVGFGVDEDGLGGRSG